MNNDQQVRRIEEMEEKADKVKEAISKLSDALDEYEQVSSFLEQLIEYSQSEDFMLDYASDEAGLLPAELKRGVLSEDGISDLLQDNGELVERIHELFD